MQPTNTICRAEPCLCRYTTKSR